MQRECVLRVTTLGIWVITQDTLRLQGVSDRSVVLAIDLLMYGSVDDNGPHLHLAVSLIDSIEFVCQCRQFDR